MRVEPMEGSRVRAIVDRSIMVRLEDVQPMDVLAVSDDESDPIIEKVSFDGEKYKFHFKYRTDFDVLESNWLDPAIGGHVFIHDLHNERADFIEEEL